MGAYSQGEAIPIYEKVVDNRFNALTDRVYSGQESCEGVATAGTTSVGTGSASKTSGKNVPRRYSEPKESALAGFLS